MPLVILRLVLLAGYHLVFVDVFPLMLILLILCPFPFSQILIRRHCFGGMNVILISSSFSFVGDYHHRVHLFDLMSHHVGFYDAVVLRGGDHYYHVSAGMDLYRVVRGAVLPVFGRRVDGRLYAFRGLNHSFGRGDHGRGDRSRGGRCLGDL